MTRRTLAIIVFVGWLFYLLGGTVQLVGELPTLRTEPYQWWIVLQIAAFVVLPFALGYMAGNPND